MDSLETAFVAWAVDFFQCPESQARCLVKKTQNILNTGSNSIPTALASHEIPFAYCSAYLRDLKSHGISENLTERPVTPPLVRRLRKVSFDLGVRLEIFKNDSSLCHLPGYRDLYEGTVPQRSVLLSSLEQIHTSILDCLELLRTVDDPEDIFLVQGILSDMQSYSSFTLSFLVDCK